MPGEFAFVPWHTTANGDIRGFHDNLLLSKGRFSVLLRRDAIRPKGEICMIDLDAKTGLSKRGEFGNVAVDANPSVHALAALCIEKDSALQAAAGP